MRSYLFQGAIFLGLALFCTMFGEAMAISADDPAVKQVHEYLDARAEDPKFSAAVLIAVEDIPVVREAYGRADYELDVPLRPDHVFPIASLTKPLTATAALKLVEEERLSLSASICEYLQPCPSVWRTVLVRHLLQHTSGIPDLFGRLESVPVGETGKEISKLIGSSDGLDLIAEPGSTYAYSNFNYVLLANLMEVVTGALWEDLLATHVFKPADLRDTRYDDVWAVMPRRLHGYGSENGRLRKFPYMDHAAYAAGGLVSTVDDLMRWHAAFWQGRLISRKLVMAALEPGVGGYGYGWQIKKQFGRLMHNHTGGMAGFNSHIAFYHDAETLIVVLSNVRGVNAAATACDLAAIMFSIEPSSRSDAGLASRPLAESCVR